MADLTRAQTLLCIAALTHYAEYLRDADYALKHKQIDAAAHDAIKHDSQTVFALADLLAATPA